MSKCGKGCVLWDTVMCVFCKAVRENPEKWAYSVDNTQYWGTYSTKEEALKEGIRDAIVSKKSTLFVGKVEYSFVPEVDVSMVIDQIQERASECSEYAEDYLEDVKDEHIKELEDDLNEVLTAWVEKYNYKPTFFEVPDPEEIVVVCSKCLCPTCMENVENNADGMCSHCDSCCVTGGIMPVEWCKGKTEEESK